MGKQRNLGKFLAYVLRHHPEAVGIALDAHGWADVDALIEGIARTRPFDREMLEEIVRTDEKQRYALSADGCKIRASQGHSIAVDLEMKAQQPPDVLWHGSATRFHDSIMKQGLQRMGRQYVHLSGDCATAVKVGARHGTPIVYQVLSREMYADGYPFYRAENGVWLTEQVPAAYLVPVSPR